MPNRSPLASDALATAVLATGRWRSFEVVECTSSTNADLLAAADRGAPAGTVLVAEAQTSGRGRLDRSWQSPPRAGLLLSVLVAPPVPTSARGWLPLLTGLAVRQAVAEQAGLTTQLKWPNDVLAASSGRKICGILAQGTSGARPATVIGIGLNVTTTRDELPVGTAGSLLTEGAAVLDRAALLVAVLDQLGNRLDRFEAAGGAADATGLLTEYRQQCATLGQAVRVELPTGSVTGLGVDVDAAGRLVVRTAEGDSSFAAGDVTHLRPAAAADALPDPAGASVRRAPVVGGAGDD